MRKIVQRSGTPTGIRTLGCEGARHRRRPHWRLAALPLAALCCVSAFAATPTFRFANQLAIMLESPTAVTDTVHVAMPETAAPFQGIGANLVGASDLNYVPCAREGGASCGTIAAPLPTVSAKSIRASVNLPFNAAGTWELVGSTCTPVTIVGMGLDATNPASVLKFFQTQAATNFYADSSCSGTPVSMNARMGQWSACSTSPTDPNFQSACMMDGVRRKKLDWVEIFFAAPAEFVTACGPSCSDLVTDPTSMANFAAYKAGQLVFQGRFGNAPAAPKYIELFNEPEGSWDVQVDPASYMTFVADFKSSLAAVIAKRLANPPVGGLSTGEKQYLADLATAEIIGPGLGSQFELDYANDQFTVDSTTWSTAHGAWFDTKAVEDAFFQSLNSDGLVLSTHTYDDKRSLTMPGLEVTAAMDHLFQVRTAERSNAPLVVTEAAETVQNDAEAVGPGGYSQFCAAHPPANGTTEGACQTPQRPGDPVNVGYQYPDCVQGAVFNTGSTKGTYLGTPIADFCHHQAAKLHRNLINFASRNDQHSAAATGVVAELIWSLTPSASSSEHGLISRKGLPTLMNAATDPVLSNFSADGWNTVFPVSFALDTDLGAGVFAANASTPSGARVALSNTSTVTKTVALDLGNTPMAAFTHVSAGSAIGGSNLYYTGTSQSATNLLTAPAGGFRNTSSLVVSLPPNSAVTLTLAP